MSEGQVVRLLLLSHGVGSQPKGEFLQQVVAPLTSWLQAWLGAERVTLLATLRPEAGPASARLLLQLQDRTERWEVVEGHWATAFYPESAFEVLAWGYRTLLGSLRVARKIVLEIYKDTPEPASDPVYRAAPRRWTSLIYDWIVATIVGVAWHLLYAIVMAVAFVFFLLALLPSWLLFPKLAAQVMRGAVEVLVQGVGDMLAMLHNPASLASIVEAHTAALQPYFRRLPAPDNLVVLAHSGGATAAFAALTAPSFWDELGAGSRQLPVTFMTVGSSLNFAWETYHRAGGADTPLFDNRRLPENVRWVDIYTHYDPVPHGRPEAELVRSIYGDRPFNALQVVNHDNFFDDHGAYWGNYEEFVPRLVYEMTGHHEAAARTVDDEDIAYHRWKIGAINLFSLTCVVLALVGLAVWHAQALTLTAAGLEIAAASGLFSAINGVLAWVAGQPVALFVLDIALLLLLAYVVYQFVRIVLWSVLYRPVRPFPTKEL